MSPIAVVEFCHNIVSMEKYPETEILVGRAVSF